MRVSVATIHTTLAVSVFQAAAGWQLDLLSLAGGLLLGLGLVYAVYRARPHLQKWQKRPAKQVQVQQLWERVGVEKRFHTETAAYVRDYHLGATWATLEEIFVEPLPLGQRPPVAAEPVSWEEVSNLTYLWPDAAAEVATWPPQTMSVRRLLLNGRRVIVSAPAGAGKTTLLAYCAHLCAHAGDSGPYTFLLPVMPVLVHLAEVNLESGPDGEQDPADALAQALQARSGPLTAPAVAPLLRQKLGSGDVLLLLDGWDEAGHAGRQVVTSWLARLLEHYPEIQVIVATGSRGFGPLQELRFRVSGLIPWRTHQAEMAGELWAQVYDWPFPPALEHYWRPYRFPLIATLQLWQWAAERVAGPSQLPALLDVALARFLPAGEEEGSWLPGAARALWQRLALRLLEEEALSVSQTAIQEEVAALLAEAGLDERKRAALAQTTTIPLFRQWSDESVSFLCPMWRDFLAGSYLAERKAQETVQAHLADCTWASAICFYVAHAGGDADQLAARLVDVKRAELWHDRLFQLAGWLALSKGTGKWRRQVLIRMGHLIIDIDVPEVVRERAVATIASTGESGVDELLRQLLQRTEPELRRAAVAALARFDPELSVPILERMLKDPNDTVRVATIHALGWQNSRLGETPLLSALIGRLETERNAAALVLALNGGEGWEILREAAVDNDPAVREAAARALARLDKYWAVQLLEEIALTDQEGGVRAAAATAVEAIAERNRRQPWRVAEAGELPWVQEWAAAREETVPEGTAALPTLCRILAEGRRAEHRVAAARSLARIYLPASERQAVWATLEDAAKNDAEWIVRQTAYAALAELNRGEVN